MTATQQPQMIIEAVGDFLSGENTNPCRGQLDSQGDAVHLAHDRLDRSSDILAQLEPWLHVAGSIGEKPGRIRRPCFTNVAAFLHGQRGHRPYQLPRDVKRRTARGQNRHGWTPAQQHLGHTPGRIQDMLATVQDKQCGCLAQVLHRRLQRRAARSGRPPIRARRRRPGRGWSAEQAQRNRRSPSPGRLALKPSSRAKRVLPIPPMPTRVTSRFPSRNSDRISSSSWSRPTKVVMEIGRVPVTSTSCRPSPRKGGPRPSAFSMRTIMARIR